MSFASQVGKDFAEVLKFGTQVRFRYFTIEYAGAGSFYDDDLTLTQVGPDLYVSGMVQSLDNTEGSDDAILLQQGKILQNDSKLYIAGSIQTSGLFRIGIGSPPGREYAMVPEGVNTEELGGERIFKKVFIRFLPTGSLAEE